MGNKSDKCTSCKYRIAPGGWAACGAFNRAISRNPLVREVVPERKRKEADNTPIDGQISLEELK